MAKKKSVIPPINWKKDHGALIWKLLAEVEKKENCLVILGKNDSSENSSGMTKAAVFKAIGRIIFPNECAIDADDIASRVKSKYENVYGAYKQHVKRLRDTGGGLGGNDSDDSDESLHEYMACYIPIGGPDETTTEGAKNLWDKITKEFPFFPTFHRLYSTRPNVNPPVIITGVGPGGRKMVHLQPPSKPKAQGFPEHLIDPSLVSRAATPPANTRAFGPDWPELDQTPIKQSPPRRSPLKDIRDTTNVQRKAAKVKAEPNLSAAIQKARSSIRKLPKKRTLEDTLVSLHESTVQQAAQRAAFQDNLAQRRLMLDEKAQLIEMQKLGLYTKEEFLAKLAEIEQGFVASQPKPVKRRRLEYFEDSFNSDIEILSP
ncbi:hypothetical protein DFH09DRAFT_1369675 [Mycena vulgaris]|nr:hypothetical protein DFH09DRAFT_1369675 [Mycena vulgaris]